MRALSRAAGQNLYFSLMSFVDYIDCFLQRFYIKLVAIGFAKKRSGSMFTDVSSAGGCEMQDHTQLE